MKHIQTRTIRCGMLNVGTDPWGQREEWVCTLPALHNGPCDDAVDVVAVDQEGTLTQYVASVLIAVIILVVGIPAYILVSSSDALGVPVAQHHPSGRVLRACLTDEGESAFPCVWHARSMGNGKGHSFRIFRDGRVKQITHRWAFHLLGDCDQYGPIYCRSGS